MVTSVYREARSTNEQIASSRKELLYVTTKDRPVNQSPPLWIFVVEGIVIEAIDKGTAMLNGLLYSKDYEQPWSNTCIEVLPNTLHLALETSTVAKPWKEKLQKSRYFLTYPRIYIMSRLKVSKSNGLLLRNYPSEYNKLSFHGLKNSPRVFGSSPIGSIGQSQ
ncbi:hypothetical protein TNCV_902341 [Trichonephila clavipes]|nr:hypothetical protein TNCV_902341 [Trichonephila clavipes]